VEINRGKGGDELGVEYGKSDLEGWRGRKFSMLRMEGNGPS
jgi:hypothetical protein